MKIVITIFSLLTLLASASSSSSLNEDVEKFLQCLHNQIQHSVPIQDAIFTPSSSSFQQVLNAYIQNHRFSTPNTPKPLAIITAKHESHVQATINCAKENSLQIRIRSGGHDFEGLSYRSDAPFVILNMFNLRSIDIDMLSETAWVQSGAILGELYYEIWKASEVHALPSGMCLTLRVGGHFSGGGYGNLMRKYGLSVDNIIDALFIDYNGNIYDRRSMGEDLFWAVRGGGGSSFGAILSWKIKLVRVPSLITVFQVPKTLEEGGTEIVYKWQEVSTQIDRDVFIRAQPEIQNPENETQKKTIRINFIGQLLGQKSELLSLMESKFPQLGLRPEHCQELSWIESTMFWMNFPIGAPIESILNRPVPAQLFSKYKSDYVKQVISIPNLEKIWDIFMETEGMIAMHWHPYGGRMAEISETETPFPHREGYLFSILYLTVWFEEGEDVADLHIKSAQKCYQSMAPYVSKFPREVFLNYRDLDIGSNPSNETIFEVAEIYGRKYFRNNFLKLAEIKKRVDPLNFFRNEQSIPPISL